MRTAKLAHGVLRLSLLTNGAYLTIIPDDGGLPFRRDYEWWQKERAIKDFETIRDAASIRRKKEAKA